MQGLVEQVRELKEGAYEKEAYATYQFIVELCLKLIQQKKEIQREVVGGLVIHLWEYGKGLEANQRYGEANSLYQSFRELARYVDLKPEVLKISEYLAHLPAGVLASREKKQEEELGDWILAKAPVEQLKELLIAYAYGESAGDKHRLEKKITGLISGYTYAVSSGFIQEKLAASVKAQEMRVFMSHIEMRLSQISCWLREVAALREAVSSSEYGKLCADLGLESIRAWYTWIVSQVKGGGFPDYDLSSVIQAYERFNAVLLGKLEGSVEEAFWLKWREKLKVSRASFLSQKEKISEIHRLQEGFSKAIRAIVAIL